MMKQTLRYTVRLYVRANVCKYTYATSTKPFKLKLILFIIYTLRFNDKPKLPGPTPFVNPEGPKNGAYSSGTQLN